MLFAHVGQIRLVGLIAVAGGQARQRILRFFKVIKRFSKFVPPRAQAIKLALQSVRFLNEVLVCASRLAVACDQFAKLFLDRLRQSTPAAATEDSTDFGFQGAVQVRSGTFGEIERAEGLPLLYPEDIPHAERFRLCTGLARFVKAEKTPQRIFGSIAFKCAPVRT